MVYCKAESPFVRFDSTINAREHRHSEDFCVLLLYVERERLEKRLNEGESPFTYFREF